MLILVLGLIAFVVVGTELLYRKHKLHGEIARKSIHILSGVLVATWPYYFSWMEIRVLSLLLLAVVFISWRYHILSSIHTVERKTWGELLFPLGILLTASLTTSKWIFAVAMLHLAVADGLAAIIGESHGKKNRYKVFGHTKSVTGSTVFWAVSVLLISLGLWQHTHSFMISDAAFVVGIALLATAAENIGVIGFDNVLVPLVIILGLRLF